MKLNYPPVARGIANDVNQGTSDTYPDGEAKGGRPIISELKDAPTTVGG